MDPEKRMRNRYPLGKEQEKYPMVMSKQKPSVSYIYVDSLLIDSDLFEIFEKKLMGVMVVMVIEVVVLSKKKELIVSDLDGPPKNSLLY